VGGAGRFRGPFWAGKLWRLMAQSSIMANKESGKNIVFDNQTENVHSLSQNKERGWDRKKEKTGQQKAQKA